MNTLGETLRAARLEKGLTTGQLARMIDKKLRHRYIQTVENGSVEPTLHMLERIVAALDRADVVTTRITQGALP